MSSQMLKLPATRQSRYRKKVRIGIDATAIVANGKGVCRYEKNLVRLLIQLESDFEYFVFINENYSKYLNLPQGNWHLKPIHVWKQMIWEQLQFPYQSRKLSLDLLHYTNYRLPSWASAPIVQTVFEVPYLIPQKKANWYAPISNQMTNVFFPRSLQLARRIIVASYDMRDQLIHHFQVPEQKIRVIYPGCEDSFRPQHDQKVLLDMQKKINLPKSYILSFATGDPREQTEFVLKAFRQARKNPSFQMKLVLVGNFKGLISEEGIVSLPYLSEEELIAVYQSASLYVDSSIYEGFGFHVVEAMACGIPVIAFKTTSIPEILGSCGAYILPDDSPDVLARTMIEILSNSKLMKENSENGLKCARKFNWKKTAEQTLSVYEEVLNAENRS